MHWFGHKSFSFPYKQKSVLAWWDLEKERDNSSLVPGVLWTPPCISVVTSHVVSGTEKIWFLYKPLLHNLGKVLRTNLIKNFSG